MINSGGLKHCLKEGDLPDLDPEEEDARMGERRNRRYYLKRPRRRRTYRSKH